MSVFKAILVVSDLVFPLWWIAIMIFCMKRGLQAWKAWLIASSFCVGQAYIVAKTVGWNLGGYLLVIVGSIPSMIPGMNGENGQSQLSYWLLPPILLIILPAVAMYVFHKVRAGKLEDK